jgi:hypothetical protein
LTENKSLQSQLAAPVRLSKIPFQRGGGEVHFAMILTMVLDSLPVSNGFVDIMGTLLFPFIRRRDHGALP